ncbi:MAG: hypothetical protein IEMM0002_0615 [bacterium]|nr:MAG: hypothetical protein IEMM0002_0615 [bacterium]
MSRLKVYVLVIQLLAPLFMLVINGYAEDQNMSLQGKGLSKVFINIQTNDHVMRDALPKELQDYMKSRLNEINIESSYSRKEKSDAKLTLSFHIGPVINHEKYLGYDSQGKYVVFMELTFEQSVTFTRDPSITAMVPTWTSDRAKQVNKKRHIPFIASSSKFEKEVFAELKELMDEFVLLYKSTHY